MGSLDKELYFPTAAPTVVRDLVIVGGLVWDNQKTGEPSGVVRAFDVRSGALVWAWDLGNPAIIRDPPEGQSYTPDTPNVWSTPAFDDELGLIYLPTGNATPDFWGGQRSPADEFVVISAGGNSATTSKGDYVVAYALPQSFGH
jgi:quinate dehydrogenase (quinone)